MHMLGYAKWEWWSLTITKGVQLLYDVRKSVKKLLGSSVILLALGAS